ncbi:hypothetical protein PHYPSEUDO_011126 [Phytophthora pseudosyringae]|uniref:Uncharacterized protein n=1 Tax=Phytophthora pseudosyringae TaxID=221518 RepID=A0A8T1VC64_9STRA|nr:hypothetical protein PHYPSEUDO_011126 [Phytophthora pseudosyringae]
MGTSTSKASPLAPTFERMTTWDLKASRGLLQTYKDKDLDFGLDSQGLADLVGGDKDWAEGIIDAFKSSTGIINALAFICGACLVSSGPALEKAGMIFDALDFDGTEQISMDEMTIAFLCCARGVCVVAGVGTIPSDEELESVTLQAYRDLNKGSTQSITKSEFTKWALEFASGTGAPITREVTLQKALEQFRVVPPTEIVQEKEDNNFSTLPVALNEAPDAQVHEEITQADTIQSDDPLEQALADAPTESAADSAVELSEPADPEFVVDEHAPSAQGEEKNLLRPDSGIFVGPVGGTHAEVTTPEDEPEQQIVNDSYEPGIEAAGYCGVTADAESDYPTFVADAEEPSHVSDVQVQSTCAHEQTSDVSADAVQETEMTDMDTQKDNASNNTHLEARDAEPVAASDELAAEEAPPDPAADAEFENGDFAYEQDEFVQETPRTERVDAGADAVGDSPPGNNSEGTQPTENPEQSAEVDDAPIEPAAELPEVASAQEVVENEMDSAQDVDEAPEFTMAPDAEPVIDPENASLEDSPSAVTAVADPTRESPRTDLNAFDTYDYQDPGYDGSSGLPPPEPRELLDDSTVAAVDTAPAEAPGVLAE